MKLYLPHNAGSVDLGIDVDLSQSSEADRAFVAGLLRVTAERLSPTPVVESTPIISPAERQTACDPSRRTCVICWYGPECGPFYGIERTSIDTERRCPCDCHGWAKDAKVIPEIITSTETTKGEPAHERHDELLPLPMHEVSPEMRGDHDPGDDAARGDRISQERLLQRASDDGSGDDEPVAEAEVRATPTMTPEETMIWEAEQKALPIVTKPKADRSKLWTPEMREAAAERARNRRKAAPFGLRVGEAEPPPLPKAFSLKGPEPQEAPPLATAVPSLPEEQAPPAAMPPAGDPLPEEEIPLPPPAKASEPLPPCSCPSGWWTAWQKTQIEDLKPSSKHNHACPLHRHRHVFPTVTDADGALVGRCECGHTETRYPYQAEDDRAPAKAAAKHRANIALAPREPSTVAP